MGVKKGTSSIYHSRRGLQESQSLGKVSVDGLCFNHRSFESAEVVPYFRSSEQHHEDHSLLPAFTYVESLDPGSQKFLYKPEDEPMLSQQIREI